MSTADEELTKKVRLALAYTDSRSQVPSAPPDAREWLTVLCDAVDRLTAENATREAQTRHWKLEADRLTAALKASREENAKLKTALILARGYVAGVNPEGKDLIAVDAALAPAPTQEQPWFKCSTPNMGAKCEKGHACLCLTGDGRCSYGMEVEGMKP